MGIALWAVQVLVAASFLGAGATKLSQPKEKLVKNMAWVEDFSQGTVRLIGALEVLGAIGVVVPALTGSSWPPSWPTGGSSSCRPDGRAGGTRA